MVTNGKVRVVRFFSKALIGPQLNWNASLNHKALIGKGMLRCHIGIFYGVRLFEDRPFILKTDHMNLTYLNVTLTGKVIHQGVLCENHMPLNKAQRQQPCQPCNRSSTSQTKCMTKLQRFTTQAWAAGIRPSAGPSSTNPQYLTDRSIRSSGSAHAAR
jgi:hypothetical protein